MKLFLLGLVLSVVPPWVSATTPRSRVGDGQSEADIACFSDAAGSGAHARSTRRMRGADQGTQLIWVTASGDGEGRSAPKTLVVSAKEEKKEVKRGYLGVSLDRVPKALSEQLDLDSRGVMITDVVDDGPADKAGLEAHDLLVSFDGKTVEGDLAKLSGWIRDSDPGDEVTVKVLRKGKEKSMEVTIGGRPGDGDRKINVQVAPIEEDDDGRGFLGVMLEEVPPSLAAHLDLGERGVIVTNVMEGGPADKGGLELHDIVLAYDGKTIEGDQAKATAWIKNYKAGESVTLTVLRKGKERSVKVTLGARELLRDKKLKWKSDRGASAELEDEVRIHGKMLRKAPTGEWTLQDLGEIHELEELPKQLQMFVPRSGSRSTQVTSEDGKKRIRTKVEQDGHGIIVEQEGDGEIKITRRDSDGEETTRTFRDADDLRKDDEEAADLLDELDQSLVVRLDGDDADAARFGFAFDFDSDDWNEHLFDWREKMDDSMREAAEAYHDAMKDFHEAMRNWGEAQKSGHAAKMPRLPRAFFSDEDGAPFVLHGFSGKPKQSFEVRGDGKIEVRIRRGDSEVVRVFENEKELRQRDSELHQEYEKVMSENDKE